MSSAVSYGAGGFIGGQGGRRRSPTQMSTRVEGVGLTVAAVAVGVATRPVPDASTLAWGALSGVGSAVGNVPVLDGRIATLQRRRERQMWARR